MRQDPPWLGDEPPLVPADVDPARFGVRQVRVRWAVGAAVTLVTSTALMAGALLAAMAGSKASPVVAEAPLAAFLHPGRAAPKSGLALRADEETPTRRMIEVTTETRRGDERILGKHPYALVEANLELDRDRIGDIPKFDPRIGAAPHVAEADGALDRIAASEVDGEVTITISDFPSGPALPFDDGTAPPLDTATPLSGPTGAPDGPITSSGDLFYVPRAVYVPPNVIVVPENVSAIAKSDEAFEEDGNTVVELLQDGDTLGDILLGSGVSETEVDAILAILGKIGAADAAPGEVVSVTFLPARGEAEDEHRPVERLSLFDGKTHVATVARNDRGGFVPGAAPAGPAPDARLLKVEAAREETPTIYESLYQTGRDIALPGEVLDTLLATFANEVDFVAPVHPGARLTVLHSVPDAGAASGAAGHSEILYAALEEAGVETAYYRFKDADGAVDYYDRDGRTGRSFLVRKPMERGIVSSTFGPRRHPIYHTVRSHNGVDYAAPRGTPIYAAGDGVVTQAGWTKGGYGRSVTIQHAAGYVTIYGHQSRIADGVHPGLKVSQGDVIGYVGSTGYSTGPHLHFEIRIKDHPVNPLKLRLRRAKELSGDRLAAFLRERDRIDDVLAREHVTLAAR
ncbi:M23 family metallopeptidase [Acuticoccus kandeliae]|uniref:M23 family metallopeptidase n=1 Tax=Acuticoccus kandeliae TaxID=2073160 RepID=UPI0013006D03|nr:M23 family metallopeptidase [Acuticoccus kandeliae]